MTTGRWAFMAVIASIFIVEAAPGASASVDELIWLPLVAAPPSDADKARNDSVTCIPANAYNPDAGILGPVTPFIGTSDAGISSTEAVYRKNFHPANVHLIANADDGGITSTLPIYICWKRGLTRTNYRSVCASGPLYSTSPWGNSYAAKVGDVANSGLVCLHDGTTDAGYVIVPAEFAQ